MTEKTIPEIVEDAASARDILNAAVVHEAFEKLRQQAIQDIIDATRRGLTAAPACAILVALEDLIHELKLTETEEVLLRKNRFRRVR